MTVLSRMSTITTESQDANLGSNTFAVLKAIGRLQKTLDQGHIRQGRRYRVCLANECAERSRCLSKHSRCSSKSQKQSMEQHTFVTALPLRSGTTDRSPRIVGHGLVPRMWCRPSAADPLILLVATLGRSFSHGLHGKWHHPDCPDKAKHGLCHLKHIHFPSGMVQHSRLSRHRSALSK